VTNLTTRLDKLEHSSQGAPAVGVYYANDFDGAPILHPVVTLTPTGETVTLAEWARRYPDGHLVRVEYVSGLPQDNGGAP